MNIGQADNSENAINIERIFEVRQITEKDEKLKYLQACDSAYTISVLERNDFDELFEKIDRKAFFLGGRYLSEYAGYAAVYINDFKNFSAYITLICVSDKYQRKHLGSILLMECINIAKKSGMKNIRLEVLKEDDGAIHFYKKNAFEYEKEASSKSIYMQRLL